MFLKIYIYVCMYICIYVYNKVIFSMYKNHSFNFAKSNIVFTLFHGHSGSIINDYYSVVQLN